MGICLGAQLIACVLGATVCTNRHKEIGWFPIKIESSLSLWSGSTLPPELIVFHWHGDKFEIPYGAINHAASAACDHQLFTYNSNIIGIQFHLEATPYSITQMMANAGNELTPEEFIQDENNINDPSMDFDNSNQLMATLLDKLMK